MQSGGKKLELIFLFILIIIIIGMPMGIRAYDRKLELRKLPPGARVITLTGHAQRGWIIGDIRAFDIISLSGKTGPPAKPVIEVAKDELVVLKLKSSDVVHGFGLKDLGIFITDGIKPGKILYVSFKTDRVGTYTFSCNAICGDNHQNMQGTLIVTA